MKPGTTLTFETLVELYYVPLFTFPAKKRANNGIARAVGTAGFFRAAGRRPPRHA